MNDLRFRQGPLTTPPIDLVFGGVGGPPPVPERTLVVDAVLPKVLRGYGVMAVVTKLVVDAVLPKVLRGYGAMEYQSRNPIVVMATHVERFQQATQLDTALFTKFQQAITFGPSTAVVWEDATALQVGTEVRQQDATRLEQPLASHWQDAIPVYPEPTTIRFQDSIHNERPTASRFQDAIRIDTQPTKIRFQQTLRTANRVWDSRFQDAIPLSLQWLSKFQQARRHHTGPRGRFQDALQPRPGKSPEIVPPLPDPCYIPPPGDQVHLVFNDAWSNSPNLVFFCERHGEGPPPDGDTIIVPVRRVYVVINNASLVVDGSGQPIHALSMNLGIDVDSWTWTFSATLMGTELTKVLQDDDGVPVIVRASINGTPYRMVVESVNRDRTYPTTRVQIQGRGLSAALDAPYSPILNFGNDDARTAAQLMDDVLLDNGVPMDWTVDWQLEDWEVPGGLWKFSGSRMAALLDIAGAAGGYIQTHPNAQMLRILPRYPSAPWNWGDVTPGYELPSAPVTNEGISWAEKARYNRVYVSGIADGVLGRVTRLGSDGGTVAQMVTHSLITDAIAARQRGTAILSDTGRVATVSLSLPVLPETGIILPGTFIRYVDGATTRLGLTRSTSVAVNFPKVRQTISLETHP